MKKFLCMLLSVTLTLIPVAVTAQTNSEQLTSQEITILDVHEGNYSDESVLTINSSQLNEIDNLDSCKNFIINGGIIVVNNDNNEKVSLCKELDMQIEPELINSEEQVNSGISDVDLGKDIVTMYYKYGNSLTGIYVINAQHNITSEEEEELINEAIDEIHNTQSVYSNSIIQPLAASNGKSLGSFTVTTTRLPKGKLTTKYEFFTVQNYNGEDYYTVKANISGYPGASLSTNSSYNSKYKGKSLGATIKSTTGDAVLDAYGPYRTVGSSTYSVSVGGSFNADADTTFGSNFSYTKTLLDTTIDATSGRFYAEWTVDLESKAEKRSITFVPACTFSCPSSKTSINVALSSNYVVDSWDTFKETLSLSRNVKCTPSSHSQL